jgi:Na+-translocating ferredoxin:NAD+ oxidoreductase subunit B
MMTSLPPGAHPEHVELAKIFTAVKVMGPPLSEILVALIAHLFTRDEARIGTHLSFLHPRTAEYISKKTGIRQEELFALLEEMCRKRSILKTARGYMLYPLIPGTFEHILRTGDGSRWHNRYAELIIDLINTGYMGEYLTRPINAIRNIPVQETVQDKSSVASADLISEMIEFHRDFAVFHTCPCRQSMHLTGHTCRRAAHTDGCLTFGEFSKGVEANGNGRLVSKSEMYDIVAERMEKQLVFFTSNAVPSLQTAGCTCCDCCCHGLGLIKNLGGKLLAPPHYIAAVDDALCDHCGGCVKPCNTHAHAIIDRKHVYHYDKCVGCGNCVTVCERNAIGMVENRLYRPPSGSYKNLILRMIPAVIRMGIGIKLKRYFSRP